MGKAIVLGAALATFGCKAEESNFSSMAEYETALTENDEMTDVSSTSGLDATETEFVGDWALESSLISFLNEDGSFDTIPTTINAGELSEIEFVDDRPNMQVLLDMQFHFREDGSLMVSRYFNINDESLYEMDEAIWWVDEEYLNIETLSKRLYIYFEFWSDGSLSVEMDRNNPLFVDDSCMMSGLFNRRSN